MRTIHKLLLIAFVPLALLLSPILYSLIDSPFNNEYFDAQVWKERPSKRMYMSCDLLDNRLRKGMTPQAISKVIGKELTLSRNNTYDYEVFYATYPRPNKASTTLNAGMFLNGDDIGRHLNFVFIEFYFDEEQHYLGGAVVGSSMIKR